MDKLLVPHEPRDVGLKEGKSDVQGWMLRCISAPISLEMAYFTWCETSCFLALFSLSWLNLIMPHRVFWLTFSSPNQGPIVVQGMPTYVPIKILPKKIQEKHVYNLYKPYILLFKCRVFFHEASSSSILLANEAGWFPWRSFSFLNIVCIWSNSRRAFQQHCTKRLSHTTSTQTVGAIESDIMKRC